MKELRLLLIEDSQDDAKLLLREFRKAEYQLHVERVETTEQLAAALEAQPWDLVISDYHLPRFNGIDALGQVKATHVDLPFIIVSGNIGEETAVAAMKAGADDYLMKDNLHRLVPAVERTLREAENRRQRRTVEQKIHENEAQLEALFNSSIQATYLVDSELKIKRMNRLAREHALIFLGREPHEGDPVLNFIVEDNQHVFVANFNRCLGGKVIVYEHPVMYPSKEVRWYQVKYYPVYDRERVIIGVAFSTFDITKKKGAELELQELRLRLEGIITSAMDAIITVTEGQRIILFNKAAEQMFGYRQEDLLGKSLAVLIPERYREGLLGYLAGLARTEGNNRPVGSNTPLTGLRADGTEFPIEASLSQAEVGDKKYFTVILRDITRRLAAERQEKSLNQELIRQNEQLQQFGFITSHNIRGPVASLLGLTHLLNVNNPTDPENAIIIRGVALTVQKLDNVISDLNQILDYKRDLNMVKEPVGLEEAFTSVCVSVSQWIQESGCELRTDFSGVPVVFAVKSYLHSILYNLLTNAIKFRSPDRPLCVSVAARRENGYACIAFNDNGLGFDLEKYRTQVFGLYRRFHLHAEGKGLGLHLTKTQVEALNGSIKVESRVGEGTTFTICLPEAGTPLISDKDANA
jgi:PAS domain S-box-containing protein